MQLNWNDFTVITTRGNIPNQIGWHPSPAVFSAETCARHIYVGLKSDFKNVPDELFEQPRTPPHRGEEARYSGIDAYCFLGQFMAGLKGHYHVDKEVSGQVTRAWNDYVSKNPDDYKKLKLYMDAFFSDAALVKTKILNPWLSRPTPVNTAVRMADLSPSDRVLVVGGAKALSVEVISALGHKKRDTPDTITLTHPDDVELNAIVDEVQGFGKKCSIQAELLPVPFSQALNNSRNATTIFNAAAVFVCQPMQENVINQKILNAWNLRSKVHGQHSAKLIHLKGNPLERGKTTGAWESLLGTNGFIPYSSVIERNNERLAVIRAVVAKAEEAIKHLGELRAKGDRASSISFEANSNEMTLEYTLARRSRGSPMAQDWPQPSLQGVARGNVLSL